MHSAPPELTSQPTTALAPSGASATGSMKMPEPIIVPTTRAAVIHRPICWCRFPGLHRRGIARLPGDDQQLAETASFPIINVRHIVLR